MRDEDSIYLVGTFALLSALLSFVIIILLVTRKNLFMYGYSKYVLVLQIIDLLLGLTFVLPAPLIGDDTFCAFEGFFNQFFSLLEVLWTGIISLSLYYELKMGKGQNSFPFYKSIIGVTLFSFVMATIPLFSSHYRRIYQWCTIPYNNTMGKVEGLLFFYFFLWVVIIFNTFSYMQIVKKLKSGCQNCDEGRSMLRRLRLYPLGLPLFFTLLTIVRIGQAIDNPLPSWFILFSGCCARSIGIYNAIVYGLNRHVRSEIKNIFRKKKIENNDMWLT